MPANMQDQRWVLRFGAVTHKARVWLGDRLLGEHTGGFLPFEFDITEFMLPGQTLPLVVEVDNRIGPETLPMGKLEGGLFTGLDAGDEPSVRSAGENRQRANIPNFDFYNYAGIIRPVSLYTTPRDYIKDITLVPEVRGTGGVLHYQLSTTGSVAAQVSIVDEDGNTVATATGNEGSIELPHVNLWNPTPGYPYLYRFQVNYGEDCYSQTFGFRTVEVKGQQLYINGKPFYFKGFGKHEDSPYHGRGHDLVRDVKDISLMKWIHANSIRTSHYPYNEDMMNLCDREGIVVIDETTAVGIKAFQENDPHNNPGLYAHHAQVLKDLIARDKNHPCVVMWSLGNEPDTDSQPQAAYECWYPLYQLAHELDPQNRPVTLVSIMGDYTKDLTTKAMDVVCINRYYGWYNYSGDMDGAVAAFSNELDYWVAQGKPVIITEYGADTMPGIHMTVPEMFSEEFQVQYYERTNELLDQYPFVIGEHPWNFADFATQQSILRLDGNHKGLFTRERRPKMAAHYFRKRWGALNAHPSFKAQPDEAQES